MKVSREIHTKRRTPTPTKTTFAGDNTCETNMRVSSQTTRCPEAHQANALPKCRRKGIEYINRGVEPLGQLAIAAPRLIELLALLLKDGDDGAGRVACLELRGEWMHEKVLLCSPFVCFQGIIEYNLKIGG